MNFESPQIQYPENDPTYVNPEVLIKNQTAIKENKEKLEAEERAKEIAMFARARELELEKQRKEMIESLEDTLNKKLLPKDLDYLKDVERRNN